MVLFSSSKIDGSELQECLAYFEAETRVIAFQTKEADLFNNAMVKYGNSIMQDPLAAEDKRLRPAGLCDPELFDNLLRSMIENGMHRRKRQSNKPSECNTGFNHCGYVAYSRS